MSWSINRDLESLEESDLQALVDNETRENKTIEYKKNLVLNTDSEKKEFLADVSSFANASGGHIIFGIKAVAGMPQEIVGLTIENIDEFKLKIEEIIRNGIEPRIQRISIQEVNLSSNSALVIQIPKSWALPHMIKFKGSSKFFSRNSAGKYPLDVTEIRSLFLLSENITERIRNFRTERLSKIVSNNAFLPLPETSKFILHLIPLESFEPVKKFDLSDVISKGPAPMWTSGWNKRINFDGFMTFRNEGNSEVCRTYLQFYSNGIIEAVETSMIKKLIPSIAYEKLLIKSIPNYLEIQKNMGVNPPIAILLSFQGVRGHDLAINDWHHWNDSQHPIDRDDLFLPEILIESFDVNIEETMRPIFDMVWNAAGWDRSRNYNKDGKWEPPSR